MNRKTWDQHIKQCITELPLGRFDLKDLYLFFGRFVNAYPQPHCGRFLAEDVAAGRLPGIHCIGKGLNDQNIYEKIF